MHVLLAGDVACKIVNGLPLFSITSSIYTLILMSVERYRAIVLGSADPVAKVCNLTGLHTKKALTHTGTSSPQILLLSAHAYLHFAWELELDSQCVHHGACIQV